MDKSELYISMCNKAKEIQDGWEVQDGDYFQYFDEGGKSFTDFTNVHPHGGCFGTEYRETAPEAPFRDEPSKAFWGFDGGYEWDDELICLKKDAVFCPRQDQLQEMVIVDSLPIFGVKKGKEDAILGIVKKNTIDKFKDWLDYESTNDHSFCLTFNSMEKFWLAFVMLQKYTKAWDDDKKDWIKL